MKKGPSDANLRIDLRASVGAASCRRYSRSVFEISNPRAGVATNAESVGAKARPYVINRDSISIVSVGPAFRPARDDAAKKRVLILTIYNDAKGPWHRFRDAIKRR